MQVSPMLSDSDPERSLQRVLAGECGGHHLHQQQGALRPEHGLQPVLPAAGSLPGHPSDRLERRQLRPRPGTGERRETGGTRTTPKRLRVDVSVSVNFGSGERISPAFPLLEYRFRINICLPECITFMHSGIGRFFVMVSWLTFTAL